jgi:hypothetical protein
MASQSDLDGAKRRKLIFELPEPGKKKPGHVGA